MDKFPDPQSRFTDIRLALQELHRRLLHVERLQYERSFGRVHNLLQLAAGDPAFAWIRALSQLMVRLDERIADSDHPLTATDVRLAATQVRALVSPDENGTVFQHHYYRALQEHPDVVMAHSGVVRSLPPASPVQLFKAPPVTDIRTTGPFTIHAHHPGDIIPGHGDHGYGPLAVIAESFLKPGTYIRMHEHTNDEIISYVPEGVMRHDDRAGGPLVVDSDHLMVMNAGSGFWHEERVLQTDPSLRMLQIFVRPHALGLEPGIQHGTLSQQIGNEWRQLVGPEHSIAPFFVRNQVLISDVYLDNGASVTLPHANGMHTYFFVFSGAVSVDGVIFGTGESGLVASEGAVLLTASEMALVIAFMIEPDAKVTRAGTIGR